MHHAPFPTPAYQVAGAVHAVCAVHAHHFCGVRVLLDEGQDPALEPEAEDHNGQISPERAQAEISVKPASSRQP